MNNKGELREVGANLKFKLVRNIVLSCPILFALLVKHEDQVQEEPIVDSKPEG
jgi:hypothetical protein